MTSSRKIDPSRVPEPDAERDTNGGNSAQNGQTAGSQPSAVQNGGAPPEQRDPCSPQAFAAISFAMNRHFIDHLLRSMRVFDLDAESLILLGLVAHLGVARQMAPGQNSRQAPGSSPDHADAATLTPRPVRLRDLVIVSRLPRETIRRKLLTLRDAGRVRQTDEGWVLNPAAVDEHMRTFTLESMHRLLAAAREVEGLLQPRS